MLAQHIMTFLMILTYGYDNVLYFFLENNFDFRLEDNI